MSKPVRENRIPIMFSNEELEAIEDWRFSNRVATRADAVRRLCKIALIADQATPEFFNKIEKFTASIKEANKYFTSDENNYPDKLIYSSKLGVNIIDQYKAMFDLLVPLFAGINSSKYIPDTEVFIDLLPKLKEQIQAALNDKS